MGIKKKLIIFALALIFIFIAMLVFIKPAIKYLEPSILFSLNQPDDVESVSYTWYDDMETALKDFSLVDNSLNLDVNKDCTLICKFEVEEEIRLIYLVNSKINKQYLVCELGLLKNDDKYSQVNTYKLDIVNLYEITHYKYTCADAATQFINETIYPLIDEEGKYLYIGFWNTQSAAENLMVGDNVTDGIYELNFADGEKYYMWYAFRPNLIDRLKDYKMELTYEDEERLLGIFDM